MSRIHRILSTFVVVVTLSQYVEPKHTTENPVKEPKSDLSYKLPDHLYPTFYRLEILTNLADLNDNFTFAGRVWIEINCKVPTNKIFLHSKDLVIDEPNVAIEAAVDGLVEGGPYKSVECKNGCPNGSPASIKIVNHCYHDDYELYIITLAEDLKPGLKYTIFIPYEAELTQALAGYYRSQYKDIATGQKRWLSVTQFESTDARRAFPCFDEPAFKARFQVNLGHVKTRTSISNMRIISTIPIENMDGWVWDQYEVTVPMSTYLLAFVVSDFTYKVAPKVSARDILFRVWARSDAINQVDYASAIGPRVLEYFEQYFDVKYPLPKMDMIAIPDFNSAAMENWGLITYREKALLYDPVVSTASSQPYVASVIAHEIAHQWFGNLVTMKWWTDLWLNEGFATYVAALGVNFLHPDWNYLDEDVVENMMSVYSLDSLKSSHPISVPIGHPREIAEIFDVISYKKGSFVLRMMNLFLGEETFRNGVSNYLRANAYDNAEQDDLWECLTQEAHKNQALPPYMTVKRIMDSWTLQTGYPLITVVRDYYTGATTVHQKRFLADRDDSEVQKEMSTTRWWVPLSYTFEAEKDFNNTLPKKWISPNEPSIVIEDLPTTGWVLFNIKISASQLLTPGLVYPPPKSPERTLLDALKPIYTLMKAAFLMVLPVTGLYRVKYDEENWNRLVTTLVNNHNSIDMLSRVQLLEDSLQLAKTGDIDYSVPFNMMQYLEDEREYLPWKTALRNLGFVDKMLAFHPTYGYFKAFIKNLLVKIYNSTEKHNYKNVPENLVKIKHQTLIASWACKFEVGNCKEKAIASFQAWMNSENPDSDIPIPKDFRSHVYCTAIRHGGEKEWNFLWNRYLRSNVGTERSLILSALSCTREIWIINRYLQWSIDESSGIRKQDSVSVFVGIARGGVGYLLAKSFFKSRLPEIYDFYGSRAFRLGNFVSALASQITSEDELHDLERFTNKNEEYLRLAQKAVRQGLENARVNIQWQRKFYHQISEYLQRQSERW